MSLRVQIERNLDVTIMKFDGRVTLGEGSVSYRNSVREAVWDGHKKLALDYANITYFDSSGIGEMVSAFTIVRNAGGELVLFDLTEKGRDRLLITKLYTVFQTFPSLSAALEYFDSTRKTEMEVHVRRYGSVAVLEMQGTLTEAHGASKVLKAVEEAVDSDATSLILLCTQVLDIDDSGAQTLSQIRQASLRRNRDLVLAGVEARLMPKMSDAAARAQIEIHKSLDSAFRAFGLTVDRSSWRVEVVRAG
jgi:anti-sigma B factor antagonist